MKRHYDKGEQILTAAYEIFGKKGFYAAKMADIATEAGVAKGTLYLYYESKEELFHAVIERILQDYLHEYEQIMKEEASFRQTLTLLAKHQLRFIRDRYDFAKINMQEGFFTDEMRHKLAQYAEQISIQFVSFVQQSYPHAFEQREAFLGYLCFSGMGDGMVSDMFWSQTEMTESVLEERAQFIADLFMNGLHHFRPVHASDDNEQLS